MSYNVSLVSPVLHFRIPVELLKGTIASTIKIELADAHSERFTDSISIKAFENFFIADTLGTSFLNIDINNRMDVPPASYVLNIRSSKKNDDGTPPEKYTLTITVNAAVIAAPGTVQIERRGQLADGFECNDTLLYLKETGRKSALINPKFDKIKMVDEKNHPVSGRIILDSQQVIPAGEARELRFATVGEFPVGKTTATMELSGHQLDVPVPLTIEITTRRGKGFLIVLLVAGLSFGYITRILLTYIISINEARLPGIDLQSTLATVTKNRQDTEFISAVDRIGKALEKGLRKSKAIDVTNAITSAKNDLDAAVAAFNTHGADVVSVAEGNRLLARIALARRITGIGNQFEECSTDTAQRDHGEDDAGAGKRVSAGFEDL